MKNISIRLFSLMTAMLITLGVVAGSLTRRADLTRSNQPGISTPVAVAPAATGVKGELPLPKTPVTKGINSALASTAKISDLNFTPKAAPRNLAAAAKAAGLPKLLGSVIYSEAFNVGASGLFTIPTDESQDFERLFRYANAEYGGALVGDTYFTCENFEYPGYGRSITFVGYDMTTGNEKFEAPGTYYTYSMTYDATTSTVYAIANIEGLFALTKIEFDTAQSRVLFQPVAGIEVDNYGIWNAIACDSKGQLWAVYSDCQDPAETGGQFVCTGSTLYKIDKTTAVATKIGETGFDSLYASDAIFDPKTDRLFWTVLNTSVEGFLTEIDTKTGAASVVYAFPGNEEVTGLAIPTPEAEDDAPAAVSDVRAIFANGSLTGTVEFKAPTTFFDGTAGTGMMSYTVAANGEQVATGSTTFGAQVSAAVTVPAAGFYTFTVTVSNDAGESPKTELTAFVGADTPAATSVTANYEDGVMTVTWLPVTTSVNGGYLDADDMLYTVTRYPGNVVVADRIKATTFTENLAEPDRMTAYYYDVVATSGGLSSAPARSNTVTLGAVLPPFSATFDESLDGFKVVDANNDGITWAANDNCVRIRFNKAVDMDDWLISPALKLKGGQIYNIAAQFACGNPDYPERVEVKVGTAATPGAMTTMLLAPTEIAQSDDAPMEWSAAFMPEADGNYYVGIHGISDKNTFLLYVDNFSITPATTGDGPAAVADLTVTPGANGALTATISFTTPTKTVTGKELDRIAMVELSRGEELIQTWEDQAVNTVLTFVDELAEAGEYTYTVVAYNQTSNGPEAVASAYVGVDYPASVVNVMAFETGKPGEVTVAWDAVTTTASGASIDASLVKYQVYRIMSGTPVPLSGVLDATSYTYQAVAAGSQAFVQYAVAAITERGTGKLVNASLSANIPAGTPYHGLSLSSAGDIQKYLLGTNSAGGAEWGIYDDTFFPSQDYDNRLFAMYGPYEGNYADLYTGLVSLEGFMNPGLSFYTYNVGDSSEPDLNEIAVGVRVNGAVEFVTVKTVVVSETGPAGRWNRVVVDLSEYAGKTIQVNFYSVVKAVVYTIIDNIRVGEIYTDDLSVVAIHAPEEVTTGSGYSVAVMVSNDGTATAANYTVELYDGSELMAAKAGKALEAGTSAIVVFDLTMSPVATTDVVCTAKVVMAGDENAANNQSKTSVTITPVPSRLPIASDLKATVADKAVTLTWNEPDLDAIPGDAVTDDFEDGISFASHYGEWTFVDVDGSPVDGFQDMTLPNIVDGVTKGSFWIWDTDTRGNGNRYYSAHSGTKYLFALYRADMGQADEWAISPELDGSAQTVAFYAKSYLAQYPERIKLWYSTTTTDPKDFTLVSTINPVADVWTRYEFDVPAGAKYFAINSCAEDAFMLMVDDVTYVPAGAPRTTTFEGYDVYRNGVRINSDVVSSREYTDARVEEGHDYEYVVVAVYNKGQSLPSNVARINNLGAGIDDISVDALSIVADRGAIVVSGATGLPVAVHSVDGKTVYEGRGEELMTIAVQPGVYVVKVAQTVAKVIVK